MNYITSSLKIIFIAIILIVFCFACKDTSLQIKKNTLESLYIGKWVNINDKNNVIDIEKGFTGFVMTEKLNIKFERNFKIVVMYGVIKDNILYSQCPEYGNDFTLMPIDKDNKLCYLANIFVKEK